MKIIARILVILAVFSILAGLMVVAVNASGSSVPNLDGARQFRPEGDDEGSPGLVENLGMLALLVTVIVWPQSVARKKKRQAGIKSAPPH